MGRNFQKFVLLSWKNWLLQWRHPIQTVIEILAPVLFAALLVLIRSLVDPEERDTIHFPEFPISLSLNYSPSLPESSMLFGSFSLFSAVITPRILWSPDGNPALESIMKKLVASYFNLVELVPVANASELQRQLQINQDGLDVGVQFDDALASSSEIDKNIRVILRYPAELRTNGSTTAFLNSWFTQLTFPMYQMPGPRDADNDYGAIPNYFFEMFLTIQHDLSAQIIKHHMGKQGIRAEDQTLPLVTMQRFSYPPWINDFLLEALKSFVGIIIMLSFVYTCINTVRMITNEKETQLKEAMKIMGLPNWLHWTAWFLKIFVFLLISIILMVVLLKVSWYPDTDFSVFTYTDAFVMFVFLLFYIFTTITFCFAVSVFFSKANTAATVAGLAWFLSYCPYLFLQQHYNTLSLSAKLAAMLGHNTAMAYGFQLMVMFEGTGEGLQWSNVFSPVNPDDDLTLAHVVMMLIIDTVIYLIIALYIESVFPGEYGVAQRWYYPFTASYWCGRRRYVGIEDRAADRIEESDIYESEPANLNAGIKIRHLRKMYSNKKVAVRDLSLNMFEGHITVLLGHNGAGKTTTMSMLTGMLSPTSGTAVINGYDIRTDMDGVRDSLGLCPQHNILFDELTVKEHLYFFSKLKGMTDKKEIDAEIKKYIELLELVPKVDAKSKTLSGGMKRKLCVGIALCGKSKVCMFDEPTAGMDPAARRALWDLMQQMKKGRTILLSTHFMDEADLLGDRIAIMAGGQLQCCGTSFFLKKKYGAGYYLVMEKTAKCNVDDVTNILRRHIPSIQVQNDIGSELTYVLAKEQSSVFQEMLQDFESQAQNVGIANFGISLTTMEEVFMKVGADHGQEEENDALENNNGLVDIHREKENGYKHSSDATLNLNEEHYVTGFKLKANQLLAMVMKKVLSTFRSWVLFLIQNLIPVAFMIIAILVARVMATDNEPPRLDLSLDPFHDPITTFTTTDLENEYYKRYREILENEGHTFLDWEKQNFTENILKISKEMITTVRMRYIFGAHFDEDRIVTLFNNEPYHSPPLALQYTMNTVLREKMNSSEYGIWFTNHPLPSAPEAQASRMQQGNTMGFQLAFNIGFSLAFVSSFYVLFYIKERVNKSKHLQFVSGANVGIYWVTAYVWDFLTFVFTSLCLIITLACFQEPGFSTFEELGRVFLLLILFGLAVLPEMYLFSLRFEDPSTGYTRVTLINIVLGVAAFMVVQTLAVEALDLQHVAEGLHWAFLLVPHYTVASGVQDMYTKFTINTLCTAIDELVPEKPNYGCVVMESLCCDRDEYYLAWGNHGIGRNITFLFITATVLTVILMLIELRVFEKIMYAFRKQIARTPPPDGVDDTDVLEEKRKVRDGEITQKEYSVVLKDVTKYYDNFLAVNRLSLGIKGGECFGLLGVNGAGKTTTFKMMTGDIPISSGDAFIYGLDAKTDMKIVHKNIGYCPQFDALLDDLTGKETLIMYCLLRGITLEESKYIALNLAREFDFYRHLDKQVREYSGGNKRKLSAAVAAIGDPPIIFLDEPTTGMDPATKRNLWNTLCRIRESGKCLVLTSHSMEECEALCTRLAIMVNGTFKCLGTTQHLKNKFSQGYTLTVKLKKTGSNVALEATDIEPIERFVKSHCPSTILRESHQELLTFYIPDTQGLKWSKMFGIMEDAKQSLNIEDYSLGQSSLEQVFLYFTKFQR